MPAVRDKACFMATHPLSTENWTGTANTTHARPLEKRAFPPGLAAGQAPGPQEHQQRTSSKLPPLKKGFWIQLPRADPP